MSIRGAKSARKVAADDERVVRVTEKDPRLLCGRNTAVERVFKVVERSKKLRMTHLVFFDRHGWYCEHGKQCPAVADVKKAIRRSR